MATDEKVLDNSLESTMNMSQDDIERLLFQYEEQGNVAETIIDDPDLESLLADLEAQDSGAIQDISELLNKSEQNQAVDEEVVALLKSQEEDGLTAYDAMDLFSQEGPVDSAKKEGFISKILSKLKSSKKEKAPKEKKEKKKKKHSEKGKKKEQKEDIQDWEQIELQDTNEVDLADNSMDDALALLTGNMNVNESESVSMPEKTKKSKKKNKNEEKETEEEIKEKPSKSKDKHKAKKDKKKESKEKKNKKANNEIREKIKEKPTIADAIMELEAQQEEPPHKNKVIMTFAACILIMLGFLVVNYYFTGHANKRLAEEAYEEQDYLECYQLLYGQKLNESQKAMYKRSECILKTEIFWRDYNAYMEEEKWLEGLDELTQYVYQYPQKIEDAKTWNGQEMVETTYLQVQKLLTEEYETSVERVMQIAEMESDADYTRALLALVTEKEEREALNKKYPDMLPEEKDRLTQ